jgi:penicillin-binding protein 1A
VRDGLMAYDRRLGGWRGPVTHLDIAAKDDAGQATAPSSKPGGPRPADDPTQGWVGPLAQIARPPGMLPDWRLGVVLSLSDSEAKLGWLEPAAQSDQSPRTRTGMLNLSELAWARPVKDGKPGPTPRKMADVVQPGDVVMVEPAAAPAASPAPAAAGRPRLGQAAPAPIRLALRQIPQVQGALVSLDPTTGRVLAMVGGWSYEQSQFNRATQAQRQPGSSFKPFVYLTALEHGVSPSQRFLDAPVVIDTPDGRWRPGNYEGNFGGPTPLRVALEQSLNLVTLRVAQRVGMQAVADTAIAFHEVDNMPRVLPAALGAVQTTVLKEAGAYASLDAGGREVLPTLIDSVQDRDGQVVWRPSSQDCADCAGPANPPQVTDNRKQIADPQSVFQLVTMMQGVVQRGTGAPVAKDLGRPIAGKTGTTQDFSDAWFGGFTPDLVTVVWVGYDAPASLGDNQTGAAVAGPIWHDYMAVALKNRPVLNFTQPPGVTMAAWSAGSGMVTDAFKPDQVPGSSAPIGMGVASQSPPDGSTPAAASGGSNGGVGMSLGGLY